MSLASLIMGNVDVNGLVNNYIDIIFEQIARKEGVRKTDLEFTMLFDGRNGIHASKYIIITRDGGLRKETIFLPDNIIKKLIQNAKH